MCESPSPSPSPSPSLSTDPHACRLLLLWLLLLLLFACSEALKTLDATTTALERCESDLAALEVEAKTEVTAPESEATALAVSGVESGKEASGSHALDCAESQPLSVERSGDEWLIIGIPTVPRVDNEVC